MAKKLFIVSILLISLLSFDVIGEEADPCEGFLCSDVEHCEDLDGVPLCMCNEGYHISSTQPKVCEKKDEQPVENAVNSKEKAEPEVDSSSEQESENRDFGQVQKPKEESVHSKKTEAFLAMLDKKKESRPELVTGRRLTIWGSILLGCYGGLVGAIPDLIVIVAASPLWAIGLSLLIAGVVKIAKYNNISSKGATSYFRRKMAFDTNIPFANRLGNVPMRTVLEF